MPPITKPLPFEDLETKPPLSGIIKLSDDMQQVLSLLSGYDGTERRLLTCTPTGTLSVASARVKGIANVLADQASYTWQGTDIKISEVLIKAHPDNNSRVWVNVDTAAAANTGYPLEAGDYVKFTINNLRNLHLFIAANTEKVIIIYTR